MASLGASPVLVVGSPRSGTSWVRRILRQHEGVVCGAPGAPLRESHLFPTIYQPLTDRGFGWWGRRTVWRQYDRAEAGAFERNGPHAWVDRADLRALLAGESRPIDVIASILAGYFERHGGREAQRLVEKTPAHVHYAGVALDAWDDAVIVEMVRDGRDVAASLAARAATATWAPAAFDAQIRTWVDAVEAGRRGAASPTAAGRWLTVRYEDLVADAAAEIGRIHEFLELDSTPSQLRELAAEMAFDRIPDAMVGVGRHHFRGRPGGWRDTFDAADVAEFDRQAGPLLRSLGYET